MGVKMTKITLEITETEGRIQVKEELENINASLLEDKVGQAYLSAIQIVNIMAGTEVRNSDGRYN